MKRLAAWAFAVIAVGTGTATAPPVDGAEVQTLSNRPDKVSGGDVLIRVALPPGASISDVQVELNGNSVRDQLAVEPGGQALIGLVTGLSDGDNRIEARAKNASTDKITVVNHPITGPVFAGPHEQPFFCQTHLFRPYPNAAFLTSGPIQDPCSVPTRVDYVYRSTTGAFTAFDPSAPRPANLATTMTGAPYIVRIETGTINRAIYQIAILDDPAVPGPDLVTRTDTGWNGRLAYTFGGGCQAGWHKQGASTGGVLNDMMLTRGFAVASASLNVFGNNCNDLLAAETMMMVKERFIEAFGPPRYTLGWGCSGGSYQVHQIGDNYPGLLDGIVPQCSFPDVNFGTIHTISDARLLSNYGANAGVPFTQEELRAVSGFGVFGHIPALTANAARIDPVPGEFDAIVDSTVRYHPTSNPGGARATTYDHAVNAFGRDRDTGFARRPLDNVGIQYGLGALNAGQITKAQFFDLNEKIGGYDADANFVAARTVADPDATRAAYETGRLLNGGGGLAEMPILDFDLIYSDLTPNGDIHMKFQHFTTRARLLKANGHTDNHVMWSGGDGARSAFVSAQAFTQMAAWLDNVASDTSSDPRAVKVVKNKPATLTDGCWTGGATPAFRAEPQFLGGPGTSFCNDRYPGFSSPRMVAGGPLTNDVIQCRLRQVRTEDYQVTFTKDELARLRRIFPQGVCDWSRAGVGQRELLDTWITFTDVGEYR